MCPISYMWMFLLEFSNSALVCLACTISKVVANLHRITIKPSSIFNSSTPERVAVNVVFAIGVGQEMPSENAVKECQDVAWVPAAYVSTIFTLWDIQPRRAWMCQCGGS